MPGVDDAAMQKAVEELLALGVVKRCQEVAGQFVSSIFLVPKSNGKWRLILNLKELNSFIEHLHFKMEDIRTAVKLVSEECFMASIDLQNAYYTIPIHNNFRKFLRFRWGGQIFEFTCMPFGLSVAPWVFTKISKPAVSFLRNLGWMSVVYLDDWWLVAKSWQLCKENVRATRELLESLGFIVNTEKSKLDPSKICKFLGFMLNSTSMTLELPLEKREKIRSLVTKVKNTKSCSIREFSQFIGNITAACPAVNYGWFHSKPFERQRYLALLKSGGNYEATMRLSSTLIREFNWWEINISSTKNPIRQSHYKLTIFSDASLTGWGASCGDRVAFGQWSAAERTLHINCLELLAAFNGLKSFASNMTQSEILLKIDNSTAIAYLNKMGGTKYQYLNRVAYDVWSWCEQRQLWLFATYIPSKENTEADLASRVINIDTEWELADWAYAEIVDSFGAPEMDLFASRNNAKCERFCSWHKDPEAFCVDAFTFKWDSFYFFAFPPFSLILKTLRKIQIDQACGIVVVPEWHAQPWYPLWLALLESEPLVFQPSTDLLLAPCRTLQHPLAGKLRLMAGRLSGRLTNDAGSKRKRSSYCYAR